jgi:hypothetical protein
MDRRAVVAGYRAIFGLLMLVAIAVQAFSLAGLGLFSPANYFSFFTIQSNLIAAALFLLGAARWRAGRSSRLDFLRGGAVVYMTVTGVVYFLLLRGVEVDTTIPWVNSVVHQVMPVVVIADWLIDPPATRITMRQGLLWLSFPLLWIIYTLIRGTIVHFYPYPFLNPANGGYVSVALYCVAILVFMTAVCAGVVAVGNALGGWRHSPEAPAA